jgi:hypothetical protein
MSVSLDLDVQTGYTQSYKTQRRDSTIHIFPTRITTHGKRKHGTDFDELGFITFLTWNDARIKVWWDIKVENFTFTHVSDEENKDGGWWCC